MKTGTSGGQVEWMETGTRGRLLSVYFFTFRFLYHINILATKFLIIKISTLKEYKIFVDTLRKIRKNPMSFNELFSKQVAL